MSGNGVMIGGLFIFVEAEQRLIQMVRLLAHTRLCGVGLISAMIHIAIVTEIQPAHITLLIHQPGILDSVVHQMLEGMSEDI